MGVLVLLLLTLTSMVEAVSRQLDTSSSRIEAFRSARNAFESITRRISQATLNTYWDYDDPNLPTRYQRQSELRFLSGPISELVPPSDLADSSRELLTHGIFFQAPLGQTEDQTYQPLNNLLNTWGYYIEYTDDQDPILDDLGITSRERYRLMEMREPAENLSVYEYTSGQTTPNIQNLRDWLTKPFNEPDYQRTVADNIMAMVILPKLSKNEKGANQITGLELVDESVTYLYDTSEEGEGDIDPLYSSKHQLPPLIELTLIAVDETSAARMGNSLDLTNSFIQPDEFDQDLEDLENLLQSNQYRYRIFSTEIQIPGSKWSVE